MRTAIIGAGNGGICIGAYMALNGAEVTLYDKWDSAIAPIREKGGVDLKGAGGDGFARFATVSSNLEEAIAGCTLLMVVTPAFAHRELAQLCGPHLREGQVVVLNPGRTGGAVEFYNTARRAGGTNFIVAEAQSLIYACRRTGPAEGTIYRVKNTMALAAIPARKTSEALALLKDFYPQFTAARNVLETGFLNIGAIFHPAPTLLNIARIECKEKFRHYIDGISPCVATVLEEIDKERVAVAAALGVKTLTTVEWLNSVYGEDLPDDSPLYAAVQKQTAYRDIGAASDPYARYLTEDVPMSLVPLSELGKLAGVPTPAMDAVICLTSVMHTRDYRTEGRNLANLGLSGMTKEDLLLFVAEG